MHSLDEDLISRLRDRAHGPHPTDEPPGPGVQRVLDVSVLAEAEWRLERALPEPLRQVYLQVGNGGFGPGRGISGLMGGALTDEGDDAVLLYEVFRGGPAASEGWSWPEALLPFSHWGNAVVTCVDLSSPEAALVRFDPNRFDGDWAQTFVPESPTLAAWFGSWLDGQPLFDAA